MSENSGKTEFPLRPFTFFHRAMLISVDTQFSTHTDIKIDGETLAGYMQITVCIMHQNFPGSVIQETFVWDVTRHDRSAWAVSRGKLEKLYGERYDARVRRQKTRAQDWYRRRIEKIEPLINHLLMQMFVNGSVTIDEVELLIQNKYRPQGGAEMIARLPWDDSEDYQT